MTVSRGRVRSSLLLRVDAATADRASVTVCMRELGTEAVTEVRSFTVAEVQPLVLLNQSPLEAMDGVALKQCVVLCVGEWTARAAFDLGCYVCVGYSERATGWTASPRA